MPDPRGRRRSPARLVAPLALVLCAGALAIVVFSSPAVDGGETAGQSTSERPTNTRPAKTDRQSRRRRRNYTVKTGDTLGGIAEKTGVTVERLLALNPDLDPQALVAGQKIKLRE
jgi:LysM repeat protein